jgi:hypothetical protein
MFFFSEASNSGGTQAQACNAPHFQYRGKNIGLGIITRQRDVFSSNDLNQSVAENNSYDLTNTTTDRPIINASITAGITKTLVMFITNGS